MRRDSYLIKQRVFEIISQRNRNHPVLSRGIESSLGISGPVVRDAVRELRRSGEPIVATEGGYFVAMSAREVDLIVRDLQSKNQQHGENAISHQAKGLRAVRISRAI